MVIIGIQWQETSFSVSTYYDDDNNIIDIRPINSQRARLIIGIKHPFMIETFNNFNLINRQNCILNNENLIMQGILYANSTLRPGNDRYHPIYVPFTFRWPIANSKEFNNLTELERE